MNKLIRFKKCQASWSTGALPQLFFSKTKVYQKQRKKALEHTFLHWKTSVKAKHTPNLSESLLKHSFMY